MYFACSTKLHSEFFLFFSFCSRRSWFAGARTPVCFVFWGEEGSACSFESWKMCNSHVPTCLFWLDDFVGLVGRTWTLVCRLTYRLLLSTWRDLTFARSIIYPLSDRKSRSFSRFSLSLSDVAACCPLHSGRSSGAWVHPIWKRISPMHVHFYSVLYASFNLMPYIPLSAGFPSLIAVIFDRLACSLFRTTIHSPAITRVLRHRHEEM